MGDFRTCIKWVLSILAVLVLIIGGILFIGYRQLYREYVGEYKTHWKLAQEHEDEYVSIFEEVMDRVPSSSATVALISK